MSKRKGLKYYNKEQQLKIIQFLVYMKIYAKQKLKQKPHQKALMIRKLPVILISVCMHICMYVIGKLLLIKRKINFKVVYKAKPFICCICT